MKNTHLSHLESEAIEIMREAVSAAENSVMLYSVGKDSAVMLHLAKKAFYPLSSSISIAACGYNLEISRDVQIA